MEPELLLLLGMCVFGLAASVFVVFKFSDIFQLNMGATRERQSEKFIRQITRALGIAEKRVFDKARQLEALSRRLAASNLTLEDLNNMKSKFLSMVVHDVRTPLAAIRGYSELFAKSVETEKQKRMSANMVSAVDRLNLLVSDLTDVAMIEAGKLKIERKPFAFGSLVSDLMPSIEINAGNKGVVLKYDRINPKAVINGDTFRISQVLQNLLNNAIKFTPKGGVVEVSTRPEGRRLVVSVKDSGIGIHPSETKRIFEKFYQAKYQKDVNLRKQGWGLGLSIAHEIIMQHGGEIGATSQGLGKGSVFWFKLPASFSEMRIGG
ncbi:MAG: HAMP domain-containing sensor histidine kinase [Elusimicrobiota bacterium]